MAGSSSTRKRFLLTAACLVGAVAFSAEFFGLSGLMTADSCMGSQVRNEGLLCGIRSLFVTSFGPYGEKALSAVGSIFLLYCAWHIFNIDEKDQ